MAGGSVRGGCGFGDEQMDGFLPFLAFLQPLDEAFVVGGVMDSAPGADDAPCALTLGKSTRLRVTVTPLTL